MCVCAEFIVKNNVGNSYIESLRKKILECYVKWVRRIKGVFLMKDLFQLVQIS